MSAKGRKRAVGPEYDSPDHDDFPTPPWCVDRLLDVAGADLLEGGREWIEPCAGAGGIIRAVNDWTRRAPQDLQLPEWSACELQHRHAAGLKATGARGVLADFRVWAASQPEGRFDVAITNPPFDIASEILAGCQRIARVTVLLLRFPYFGSDERAEALRQWCPDIFGLPDRPTFVEGRSDNTVYGWFRWDHARATPFGSIRMLASTPVEIRRGGAHVAA